MGLRYPSTLRAQGIKPPACRLKQAAGLIRQFRTQHPGHSSSSAVACGAEPSAGRHTRGSCPSPQPHRPRPSPHLSLEYRSARLAAGGAGKAAWAPVWSACVREPFTPPATVNSREGGIKPPPPVYGGCRVEGGPSAGESKRREAGHDAGPSDRPAVARCAAKSTWPTECVSALARILPVAHLLCVLPRRGRRRSPCHWRIAPVRGLAGPSVWLMRRV